MLNVFWVHVICIVNVVQNTLMYINYISTPQEITKLHLILQLNEHTSLCLNEKPNKLVNIERCTI
jgi:hypothetical protein